METINQPYTEYDLEILCAEKKHYIVNNDLAEALSKFLDITTLRE